MTTYSRSYVLSRMLGLMLAGLVVGLAAGNAFLGLSLVLAAYLIWGLKNLFRLLDWLNKSREQDDLPPPESKGLWGEIFDSVYRLQKHHNRSRQKLAVVIDRIQESTAAIREGVVMIDKHGNLEWWNRAGQTLLGLKMPEDQGQQATNLLRDPRFADYFEQGRFQTPLEIPSPVNDSCQLQISLTNYGSGSKLLIARDVTRINQLELMRKDFVANVSHELRTPLTVIAGYLETMLDNAGDDSSLPPVWNKALQRMHEQSHRMQGLVSDLLLLSKLESVDSAKSRETVALKPLLDTIVQDARSLSGENQHQISLKCPDDLTLSANNGELRSAFSNLVFNAVRYTPVGGNIKVRWKQNSKGGQLIVEDNGVGIDPIHIPRLTERFYRVDKSRSQATGGTGLGLAIAKHVMIRHGGRISISSHPGEGSRFTCHFPKKALLTETSKQ
ncbi:MAG: phosphate regulon sensor histidine kinase PhoR [Endozoicomonas sp.]